MQSKTIVPLAPSINSRLLGYLKSLLVTGREVVAMRPKQPSAKTAEEAKLFEKPNGNSTAPIAPTRSFVEMQDLEERSSTLKQSRPEDTGDSMVHHKRNVGSTKAAMEDPEKWIFAIL